jgi:hypothetical protein
MIPTISIVVAKAISTTVTAAFDSRSGLAL